MTHLVIPDQTPRVTYSAYTGTGPLNITFPITAAEDLVVEVNGVELASTAFTFTSTSTVIGGYQAGYVTLAASVTAATVDIYRRIPVRRLDDFATGPLDMAALNTALDRLTAIAQDLRLVAALVPSDANVHADWAAVVESTLDAGLALLGNRFGYRNRLLNGAFNVNQRAATTGADASFFFDRFYLLTDGGNVTVAELTDPESGRPSGVRLTQPDATPKRIGFAQIVESQNIRDLRGAAVAMAARIRCSSSQAIRMAILEWNGTRDSVTRDVVNSWSSTAYTAGNFFVATNTTVVAVGATTPAAATWTDMAGITGAFTTSMNNAIVAVWTEGTLAQNATLDIDQIQLEAGAACGVFQRRAYDEELARCRWHFRRIDSADDNAANFGAGHEFSTTHAHSHLEFEGMRTEPTITSSAASTFAFESASGAMAGSAITIDRITRHSARVDLTVSGAAGGRGGLLKANASTAAFFLISADL